MKVLLGSMRPYRELTFLSINCNFNSPLSFLAIICFRLNSFSFIYHGSSLNKLKNKYFNTFLYNRDINVYTP